MKLTITDLGVHGEGVGRDAEGRVYFIDGALPGEIWEAEAMPSAKRSEARAITCLYRSPHRVEPACPLFGRCGGCDLLHLDYEEGLRYKHRRVADALARIGRLDPSNIAETTVTDQAVPSPECYHYRNRVRWSVDHAEDGALTLGFKARGSRAICDQRGVDCLLITAAARMLRDALAETLQTLEANGRRAPFHALELRENPSAIIHEDTTTSSRENPPGDILLILHTRREDEASRDAARTLHARAEAVCHKLQRRLAGTVLRVTKGGGHAEERVIGGQGAYTATLHGRSYPVAAEAFFQVNSGQAARMIRTMRAWYREENEMPPAHVVDMYGGIGVLGDALAGPETRLDIIERTPPSDALLRAYGARDGRRPTFHQGEAERIVKTEPERFDTADVIITDPPRAGLDPSVIRAIRHIGAPVWFYVSCHPGTLARDLKRMGGRYRLKRWQTFDMFPWTGHVETVCLLVLSNSVKKP